MSKNRAHAYILLLTAAIIWGIAGPVIKLTLKTLPADVFLLYRFFLSSIAGLIYFSLFGLKLPKDKKILFQLFGYTLTNSVLTLGLLFAGMAKTTLLDMTIIESLGPLFVIITGYIFLKDHITNKELLGTLIAFLATMAIVLEPIMKNQHQSGQFLGNILIFLSLITNAISAVFLKKLLRFKVKPAAISNLSFLLGFFVFIPVTLFKTDLSSVINTISTLPFIYHLGVFYMAIFSGTIAYTLANIGQKTIEVSEAALFSYLNPVFSAILAIIWLKEVPTYLFIASSVFIFIGVLIAETKKRRYN
jgi:drug/metabolite transporter (DMT)-like permease